MIFGGVRMAVSFIYMAFNKENNNLKNQDYSDNRK